MNRFKAVITGLIAWAAAFCIQTGIAFVYVIWITVKNIVETDPKSFDLEVLREQLLIGEEIIHISMSAAITVGIAFGLWYYFRFIRKRKERNSRVFEWKSIMISGIIAIFLQLFISSILNLLFIIKPEWMETYNQLMSGLDFKGSAVTLIYVILIAPLSEEIVFRGVIFRECRIRTDFWTANIIQSTFFAIFHMNVIQGIYAMILGLFLGMAVERGRSLFFSIWLHIIFNAMGCVLVYLYPEETSVTSLVIMFVISLPVIILGTVADIKLAKKVSKNV